MKTNNLGINIVGYTKGIFGLGEAVRLNIEAAEIANISLNLIDFEKLKKNTHYKYNFDYKINLIQISLNDLDRFFSVIDPLFFQDKYTILFLVWESEYIPTKLKNTINLFNEIWTPSLYCKNIFKKVYDGPIITVPHPVEASLKPLNTRKSMVFNKDKFSYLFVFSYHSSIERKNPFHLIEAFKKAFKNNDNVELIIKTSGSNRHKKLEKKLLKSISNQKNIQIIDIDLDKNEILHLINNCDSYISMHHSEGFGLTLAEAMYFGKPTIATNYSGNTEFMNHNNSFLVDYELGLIENPDSNFPSETLWANPKLDHTIEQLKAVYQNADLRKKKAENATFFIKEKLSFNAIGSIMRNRLNHLHINFKDLNSNKNQNAYLLNQLQLAKAEITILEKELRSMKKNIIIRFIMKIKKGVRKLKGKV
ncbi:glycosyl transferase family 1 [Pseudalgibacter alginicilyticus]|uniref:Glycosyl transferase family 1 n=1 Tax=Pseudalgibacter alginicilyticus TaxID=1736674 RepID=A0A0P0D4X3_9FLAO|nr:glycosyltransferase [Pseudalgibacter alginicilyticus]ALJ05213.1 glycosyl transferase family 1 [Pseudalgibacter alginicilyticus]